MYSIQADEMVWITNIFKYLASFYLALYFSHENVDLIEKFIEEYLRIARLEMSYSYFYTLYCVRII